MSSQKFNDFNEVFSFLYIIVEIETNELSSSFISTIFESVFNIHGLNAETIKIKLEKYECLFNFNIENFKNQY